LLGNNILESGRYKSNMHMNARTIIWIIDYLTNKPQFLRLKDFMSKKVVSKLEAGRTVCGKV